jgi:hypothetical protein
MFPNENIACVSQNVPCLPILEPIIFRNADYEGLTNFLHSNGKSFVLVINISFSIVVRKHHYEGTLGLHSYKHQVTLRLSVSLSLKIWVANEKRKSL